MTRETEPTDVGEQTLMDGVRPITLRDRLRVMAASPMTPKRNPNAPQKQCDLFCALLPEVQQEAACLMVRRIAFAPAERMRAERRAQIDLTDLIAKVTKETEL